MKGLLFLAALSTAALAGHGDFGMRAQDMRAQTPDIGARDLGAEQDIEQAGVFDKWLKPNAPECVRVSDIASVSRLTKLTPEQFQFVRALYIAIPPVSRELPPGDSAIVAIAEGKRAALSIDNYLRHVTAKPVAHLQIEKIPTREYRRAPGYEKCERQSPPTIPLGRRTGISEVETGYVDEEARHQAERCLYCHIQTIYDPEKCVLCNRCVDICPEYCLKLVPIDQLNLDATEKETLFGQYELGRDAGASLSAMIKDDEKCIRCGLCAIRCPTDAMTMEVFFYEESEAVC